MAPRDITHAVPIIVNMETTEGKSFYLSGARVVGFEHDGLVIAHYGCWLMDVSHFHVLVGNCCFFYLVKEIHYEEYTDETLFTCRLKYIA